MKVAIVIINWNGSDDTISCITRIGKWSRILPSLFVVDNHSVDGEKQKLKAYLKNFCLIENEDNEGFSEGCNIGIRAALEKQAEVIFLLNNDAFIDEEDVLLLTGKMAENPDIAVIGPLIYDGNTDQLVNAGGRDIAWHYHTHLQNAKDPLYFYDVDYVSGTAMLVRSEVFNKVGLLDKRYFFSGEIADFCKRVRLFNSVNQNRYRIVIEPSAKVSHHTHNPLKDREKLYAYYTIRNRYLYVRKFYKNFLLFLYPFWIYRHLNHAFLCLKQRRSDLARIIIMSVFHGLAGKVGRIAS